MPSESSRPCPISWARSSSFFFAFDATLEVVTTDDQKLALASSGTVTLHRPDRIRATRKGGFADVEMFFDGKKLTLLGKNLNLYAQLDVPGTIEHLIDELRDTYQRPLPAADLLLPNSYDALMLDVVDIKDLGSGVIGGVECDFLAFRTDEVDFQIWIAQGKRPYPYRYVITSKRISGGPQYTVQTRDWRTGGEVAATDFSFKNTTKAKKVDLKDLKGAEDSCGQYAFPVAGTCGDSSGGDCHARSRGFEFLTVLQREVRLHCVKEECEAP
jgi:hypothetical protein